MRRCAISSRTWRRGRSGSIRRRSRMPRCAPRRRRRARLAPDLPLFAGGRSFGGRMTSQAQADQPLPGVRGLAFLGFPLHPAGKPGIERAEHLARVKIPMLFVSGARDALAELELAEAGRRRARRPRDAASSSPTRITASKSGEERPYAGGGGGRSARRDGGVDDLGLSIFRSASLPYLSNVSSTAYD